MTSRFTIVFQYLLLTAPPPNAHSTLSGGWRSTSKRHTSRCAMMCDSMKQAAPFGKKRGRIHALLRKGSELAAMRAPARGWHCLNRS